MRTMMAIVLLAAGQAWAQDNALTQPRLLKSQDLPVAVEQESLQRQYDALMAMRVESVEYSQLGSVKRVVGSKGLLLPSHIDELEPGDSAADVLLLLTDLLLANGTETLRVTRPDEAGYLPNRSLRALRLSQEIRGIPVVNSFLGINYDNKTREVSKLVANFVPDRGLDFEPKISAERAEQLVTRAVVEKARLTYYFNPKNPISTKLAWVVRVQQADGMQWSYYVNAITGLIVARVPESQSLTNTGKNPRVGGSIPPPATSNSASDASSRSDLEGDTNGCDQM
jgi:hypothetical protein